MYDVIGFGPRVSEKRMKKRNTFAAEVVSNDCCAVEYQKRANVVRERDVGRGITACRGEIEPSAAIEQETKGVLRLQFQAKMRGDYYEVGEQVQGEASTWFEGCSSGRDFDAVSVSGASSAVVASFTGAAGLDSGAVVETEVAEEGASRLSPAEGEGESASGWYSSYIDVSGVKSAGVEGYEASSSGRSVSA